MKKITLLLVSLICVACNNATKQEYFYENGNIKEQRIYTEKKDTSTYSITKYYLNGQISEKGLMKNGNKEGTWEYWYSDGDMKWTGVFCKGVYINPVDTVIVSFQKDTLFVGEEIYMRIQHKFCPIEDLIMACSNYAKLIRLDNRELYDYMIIPEQKGIIKLYFFDKRNPETRIQQTFMVY